MKNTKTNSYLPAAPRARGKSSILHSAYCTLRHCALRIVHCAFIIVALAAMTASAATIRTITSADGSASYTTVGQKITFNVFLSDTVRNVSGSPYLVLKDVYNSAGEAQATYKGYVAEGVTQGMQFEYVVRAGDFSAGVGIQSFSLNGATVEWGYDDDDNPYTMTDTSLPTTGILTGETIAIRTITFADGSTTKAAGQLEAGGTLDVEITRGGNQNVDQEFTVTVAPSTQTGNISVPSFKILSGSASATCQIGLVAASETITVTFHPSNYTGTGGDLTLTLTVIEGEEPHVVGVHNDGDDRTYSVGEKIELLVEMSANVTDVSGSPYLTLNIQNQDPTEKKAIYTDYYGKYLCFEYTVQSGDFAKDLDLKSKGFNINSADIWLGTKKLERPGARAVPVGANTDNSLSRNAEINILTITLDDYTLARSLSGSEGGKLSVEVTRRDASTKVQGFTMTVDQEGKIDLPATFSIPRDTESAFLDIDLVEATTSALTLTLHPNGYDSADGDIVLTIDIATGTKPPIIIDGPTQLEEGSGITTLNVSLPRPPKEPTTVQISYANPADSAKLELLGSTSLTWAAGTQDAKTVNIRPLDGDVQITIKATTTSTSYSDGSLSIYIINKNPVLNSPPEDWEPPSGGEGFPYTVGWSGTDVEADRNTLYAVIHWGDGHTDTVTNAPQGSAQHTYNAAGAWGITIELHDKDGGVDTVSGTAEIAAAVTITINEYKARIPADVGQNAYKGLQGLGRGSIDDDLGETARLLVTSLIDWKIKYSPFVASARLIATPERFDFQGMNSDGEAGTYTFDSFFHVWLGDEDTFLSKWSLIPLSAPVTAGIKLRDGDEGTDRQVGGVFSREHYPEDGCADIDWDELPDGWETLVWPGTEIDPLPFESTALPYGRNDNPDNDFFPACVTGIDAETGDITFDGCDFTPVGIPFINVYEVRGTHRGLNMDTNSVPDGVAEGVPVKDEPHCGSYDEDGVFTDDGAANKFYPWYGTDPTNPDTDGDKLTDGYEYFFWRRATFATDSFAEAYDPTQVIVGKPVTNALVAAAFNPCVATDHLEGDFDGDGLTDFEEFLLGTNPVHWDTDGDGMNDGWEVMWGLNPRDKADAKDNPDGDFMANDGNGRYHWDVYSHYGFDPRTAWNATYLERNRTLAMPTPNTAPYSNYHEHYLGRWCVDHGIAAEVGPMSGDFMTQPVPNGTLRFYDPTWKGNKRKVPDHAVTPAGGSGETDDEGNAVGGGAAAANGGYTVPVGSAAYIVEPIEITTHGCDSDGDGMPDGWELYIYVGTGTGGELWPIGQGASVDAGREYDQDRLPNRDEFRSVETCDYYASICTNSSFAFTGNWFNKWWPSDPFNPDTDGDHLPDGYEGDDTFRYQDAFATDGTNGTATAEAFVAARFGETTMLRGHVPGGGLNPCCIDTDMDYIPDHWEYLYAGRYRDTAWEGGFCNEPGTETGLAVQNGMAFIVLNGAGMDGTYFDSRSGYDEHSHSEDRNFDYDGDGLENYQEYWINGVRHFQYDKWVSGGDYGDYDPQEIFDTGLFPSLKDQAVSFRKWADGDSLDPVTAPVDPLFMKWDWSTYADDWQNMGYEVPENMMGVPAYPFHYMPSEIRPLPMGAYLYASTDPRLADSDGDGMDDYYEMFHGLNPILSDVADYCLQEHPIGETYDFRKYPWMAGMPNADPDGDDIPNWEESLSPDQPAPANHNTDPSPLWMTDMSYDHSFVNLYYNWGSAANYWTVENDQLPPYEYYPYPGSMFPGMMDPRPHYIFDFECNEGFDTDNDNLSDPYEINGTAGGVTDSQNPDRPIGRKALYLDGNAAARTRSICAFGPNALRSFTLEVWVMPEEPASGKMQVILERPVTWKESNTSPTYETIRRNFRLGLLADGHPFVEFDNGGKNLITERAIADAGAVLEAGKWYHLAATMDGFAGKLSLYLNGRRIASKSTTAIPYTGFTTTALNAVGSDEYHQPRWSPVVIGASDANPVGQVDGSYDFYNGAILGIAGGQPQLGDFFKGWVDEVRIWDGARPGAEDAGDQRVAFWRWPTIKDDYDNLKRYGMDEIRAERNAEVKYLNRIVDWRKRTINSGNAAATAALSGSNPVDPNDTNTVAAAGNTTWFFDGRGLSFDEFIQNAVTYILMTGGEDVKCRIPPNLICVYNFDTLPDPDYEPVQPAKFASLTGRPMDYNGVPWLRGATDRTTVYTSTEAPYLFPQYIQNLVSWQPLGRLAAAGTDTEYDGIIGEQVGMPLFEHQPDRVVNSKYWTLYTKGGQNLSDLENYENWGTDTVNSFPNSANPYGYRYETGIIVDEENHPLTMFQEAYDSEYAVLFNDLVPLRNARADMSIQLWDDPTGDKLGVNKDYDGDGLPDYWELAYGMDPYNKDQNGNGIRDDMDDFDGDGLLNFYEYQARSLNPFVSDTDADGIPDVEDSPDGKLSYGWLYTDADYVLDAYELEWDENFASPFRYDEHEDRDLDGWDNWSEGIMRTRLDYNTYDGDMGLITWWRTDTNNVGHYVTMNLTTEATPSDKASHFPMPNLKVTVDYYGDRIGSLQQTGPTNAGARLIIHAYSNKEMNGWPDAVLAKHFTTDTFPCVIDFTGNDVTYGHIRQGRNWFFAWVEIDGSFQTITYPIGTDNHNVDTHEEFGSGDWPTWTPNEPAAIADNQLNGIDIGFDLNELTFHLTDRPESFARVSWQDFTGNGYTSAQGQGMYVTMTYANTFVFKKMIAWPRTWLHEGDIIAYNADVNEGKNFGLASQNATPSDQVIRPILVNLQPESDYVKNGANGTDGAYEVDNWVHSASVLGAPELYGPIGREIVSEARPEFRFRLHPECTEFKFILKKGSAQTTILQTRVLAPGRHYNARTCKCDLVVWRFPYCVGDRIGSAMFDAGETYAWKIVAYSPAYGTDNSALVSEEGWFVTASATASDSSHVYASGGKGVIDADVSYPSDMVAKGGGTMSIRVQAFRSKSFNGIPDASVRLAAPGVCRLTGLELGVDYYIRAYIEQGGDSLSRDKWESWGYYRNSEDSTNPFEPLAVQAVRGENVRTPYGITIQDCDTDNDLLPDSYEWAVAGDFTSLGVANYAPAVKKSVAYAVSPLAVAAAANAAADLDNDGINDYDEFVSDTNPALADSDGDGIADGLEQMLGSAFDATTPQALKITSVSFDANGNPVLDWTWDGVASSTKGRAMLKAGRKVAYEVQAKVALTDPEWITIRTVYTDDIDGQAVLSEEGAPEGVNVSDFRFFRVKVGAE